MRNRFKGITQSIDKIFKNIKWKLRNKNSKDLQPVFNRTIRRGEFSEQIIVYRRTERH